MTDDPRLKVIDLLHLVDEVGVRYHDALTTALNADEQARAAAHMCVLPIEMALIQEAKRHTARVLELRRDELLDALGAVRDVVDDTPKAAAPEPLIAPADFDNGVLLAEVRRRRLDMSVRQTTDQELVMRLPTSLIVEEAKRRGLIPT